jgi:hypothetical protein
VTAGDGSDTAALDDVVHGATRSHSVAGQCGHSWSVGISQDADRVGGGA